MSAIKEENPIAEQKICIDCGFCCDGTLFDYAVLEKEEKGNLPEKIESQYRKEGEKELFSLPCAYFGGKCTIYDQKKARVCSSFRCQLLKNVSDEKMVQSDAMNIVEKAKSLRTEIYDLHKNVLGYDYGAHFNSMRPALNKLLESSPKDNQRNTALKKLQMRATVLELLLAKNFKAPAVFESMFTPIEA